MIFDKSQKVFPTEAHREIWWWAIGIIPLDVSLTKDVREKCTGDVLEGCYDWHAYFTELCGDMYLNLDEYKPANPRQYRDFMESISAIGEPDGETLILSSTDWLKLTEKLNKSKAYRTTGVTVEGIVNALKRLGLEIETGQAVIFRNVKYPKIFHAMRAMEYSPNVRDTQTRWHFANCEYRQLFKCYTPGYDELLRKGNDEVLYVANEIHSFAKEIKITRYIHFGIIKYKYKNVRILDYTLQKDDTPSLRLNMGTCIEYRNEDDVYFKILREESDGVKALFDKGLICCTHCKKDCTHEYKSFSLGETTKFVCQSPHLRLNPTKEDLPNLYRLILARKQAIEHAHNC